MHSSRPARCKSTPHNCCLLRYVCSCTQADCVYSGADDCCFKGWDLRTDCTAATLTFTDRQTHAAGVCTIASDPHKEFSLCTGSYDEQLRLWDRRHTSKPVTTQQVTPLALRRPHSAHLIGIVWWRCVESEISPQKEKLPGSCMHA